MSGNAETRTPWESLVPVGLAIFLINLDLTVVNLALPSIARDLHAGLTTIQWVVNGYLAAGASFLRSTTTGTGAQWYRLSSSSRPVSRVAGSVQVAPPSCERRITVFPYWQLAPIQ